MNKGHQQQASFFVLLDQDASRIFDLFLDLRSFKRLSSRALATQRQNETESRNSWYMYEYDSPRKETFPFSPPLPLKPGGHGRFHVAGCPNKDILLHLAHWKRCCHLIFLSAESFFPITYLFVTLYHLPKFLCYIGLATMLIASFFFINLKF